MSDTFISRDEAARALAVTTRVLLRYESRGLVHASRHEGREGYDPGEARRLWRIVSYQRDLGINLAGVEAVLRLREHLEKVHRELERVASAFESALGERDDDLDHPAGHAPRHG